MKVSYLQGQRAKGMRSRWHFVNVAFIISLVLLSIGFAAWPVHSEEPGIDAEAVFDHLNTAINWYRRLASTDVSAGSPSDLLYLQNARAQALQVLKLAFESAREEAELIQAQSAASPESATGQTSGQGNLSKATARVEGRIKQTLSRIDALDRRIRSTRGKKRQELINQRDMLQGQLDMDKTIQEGLAKMASFMTSSENTGLVGKINALEASVPDLAAGAAGARAPKATPEQAAPKASQASSSGLIGHTSVLLSQLGDVRIIDDLLAETAALKASADRLQTPLRTLLRALLKQGREAAGQPVAGSQAGGSRKALQSATVQFKQAASASLPLRQEIVLLGQVRANLVEWRASVQKEYGVILRSLVTRVVVILLAIGLVLLFSEGWRRAARRYVNEPRRRRQVLLLRRFVTGFLLVIVVILGFVSEFRSLATFAGFLTAGIAVALQTVILSIAAYFFLIGRYGVRVGDRITVSGVTGDVIDIGLLRMHLLELSGTGINLHPTGRVVVFSNSVLFQASPLFKQIPGTAYTWHEAAISLLPRADHGSVEKRLMAAVNGVYDEYRQGIEAQHGALQRIIETEIPVPAPHGQLRFTDTGLEFVARFPVEIRRASEVDDRVAEKLMKTIEQEEVVRAAVSGAPRLRSVIRG